MTVLFKKLREGAVLPSRATGGSAGLDLCASLQEPMPLRPGERVVIRTGLAVEIPPGYVGLVCARSGLSTRFGIALTNGVGVIDSDYRGEVMISVIHFGDEVYELQPGERIAQLLIIPVECAAPQWADDLSGTARGEGGFGSTGK